MSEHTPGPWESGVQPYIVPSTGEGDNFSNGDWNIFPPLGEAGPVAIVNSEANARLIAAAPGMAAEILSLQEANTRLERERDEARGDLESKVRKQLERVVIADWHHRELSNAVFRLRHAYYNGRESDMQAAAVEVFELAVSQISHPGRMVPNAR